jgi:hypothetical protein
VLLVPDPLGGELAVGVLVGVGVELAGAVADVAGAVVDDAALLDLFRVPQPSGTPISAVVRIVSAIRFMLFLL